MSAALTVFRLYAPEFATTADADVETMIVQVATRIDTPSFTGVVDAAKARLAAHEFTLIARAAASSGGAAGVGPVASLRAGDLAVAYGALAGAVASAGDDYYRSTHHGLAYLQLRSTRAAVGFGVIT
jgi:hypothetical protein